ncbi:UPF0149 family protein [Pseudomonas sp. 7P_10.2_Bac1]|uniref:UPF0149 family protein n=1 Tax=Pseudomonas sp. 7P_10.2_Bac1 TaxID=2971614 RepID=UPI0021C80992|nr:UPF0149 family protein [Pseudomonas sp. 7P_10.2_Bac1]MCU1729563.1 UPF0149 family protein [Pseudomonas sp. 7P_10.2_Bac1]
MQSQPLNDAEFEAIEDVLLKYGDDHTILNTCELDGFFTALVSSPTQVDIAEWFPAILGNQNPNWESLEEAERFIELTTRHYNFLAQQLAEDSSAFVPRFEETEHQGQNVTLAEEWCFGYIRGVTLAQWPDMPDIQTRLLSTLVDLAEQDNFELPEDLDVAAHQQQAAEVAPAARALHDYWLSQR